jgi:hypothetical protein
MGLVIYSNGIVEEMLPINDTFSDDELTQSFTNYPEIKTHRLPEIPNCWCIWGHIEEPPAQEFSKLASEIVDADVFSHILFVHDSEMNPTWQLTDEILYRPYKEFMNQMGTYIKEMMQHIETENRQEIEAAEGNTNMIFLTTLGHTQDKRVLFAFNPNVQNDEFYNGAWDNFAIKIYEYLAENFDKEPVEENKPFVIFSDTKTIVIIEDLHVDEVIEKLIVKYQAAEKYEVCSKISEIRENWYLRKTMPEINMGNMSDAIDSSIGEPKKKPGRPKKKDDENETEE